LPILLLNPHQLERSNYIVWVSQFEPIFHTYDFESFADGSETCPPKFVTNKDGQVTTTINPEFSIWNKKDQHLLSWINLTLSTKVLSTVYGLTTPRQVWNLLANRFASQSKSRIAQLKRQLHTLYQGSKSCLDYITTAKECADQLAVIGKPIDDDDLITYLMGGYF
jgi:hypothetical protein